EVLSSFENSLHQFTISQKDCSGQVIGSGLVNTVILKEGSQYVFKRQDNGLSFIFPNVETADSGIMSVICQKIGSGLTQPYKLSESSAVWFETVDDENCNSDGKKICVLLETAIKDTDLGGDYMK